MPVPISSSKDILHGVEGFEFQAAFHENSAQQNLPFGFKRREFGKIRKIQSTLLWVSKSKKAYSGTVRNDEKQGSARAQEPLKIRGFP